MDFIFGLPEETPEDVRLTLKVINDFVKMGARIHAHTFMPLPQTPFARAPAGKINGEIQKALNRLIPKGLVFGEWEKREKIANNR